MKGIVYLMAFLVLPFSWAAALSSAYAAESSLPVSGVVQHLVVPSHQSKTLVTIFVDPSFTGTLPSAIDEIIIESPIGVCPLTLEDFKYVAANREFWAVCSQPPVKGEYHITVCSGNLIGNISTDFPGVRKLSPPRSPKCETGKDGLVTISRPNFSWIPSPTPNHLYYQLQIQDSSGKMVYKSGFLEDAAADYPSANVLEADRDYLYRIRVFDRPDWESTRNRSQTAWIPFKTAAALDYAYHPPETTDDGWEIGHIQKTNLNPAPLQQMLNRIINKKLKDIHGIILIKDGKLILEEYFEGFQQDRLHMVASVTKSVNSLLFGQLVDRGLIKDLDQHAWDFFPEYDNPADIQAKKKITLRHLLTMTAGLEWDYASIPLESREYNTNQMMSSGDPVGFILARKVVAPPGQTYNYCDGLALMLGEIIHRVTGLTVSDYAKANLFEPLGITHFLWYTTPKGITLTHGGLNLRPRDMAKIGQLVLQDGKWENQQLVSSQWLRESTTAHVSGDGKGYGYQWRTADFERADRTLNIVWASGYGGQRIFIVPDLDLVAVITSKCLYHQEGGHQAERLFVSQILSAVLPATDTGDLPVYADFESEKILGCYHTDIGSNSGCVVKEGDLLQLHMTAKGHEEKCRLLPVSPSKIHGHSSQLGDFSILLKWAENGQLEHAVFKTGLTGVIMRRVP